MIRLRFSKRKVDSLCTNCKLLSSSKAGWVHRVAYFQTMQLFNCPSRNSFATRIRLPQLCAVPADRLDQTAADQFNFSFNYSSSDLLRVCSSRRLPLLSSILLRHPLRHLLLRCSINKAAPSLMFNTETNILQIRFKLPDKLSGRRTTQRVIT